MTASLKSPRLQKYILLYVLTGILLGLFVSLRWVGIIDDAYIFFRYAHNLSHGFGYAFNPGSPVEGTTSLSWTILLSILDSFGISLEPGAKTLALLSILASILLLHLQFYRWNISIAVIAVISTALITNERFISSVMLGMETGLYAFLLLALFLAADSGFSSMFSAIALGIIGVLLFLTRPETIALLFLLSAGLILFRPFKDPKVTLIPVLMWLAGILLVTAWRLALFGDFIPNSARAKSIISISTLQFAILWPRFLAGSGYILEWLRSTWLLALLGIAGLVFLWKRNLFQAFVAISICMLGPVVVLINSGDWMPLSRLLTPYLPVLAVLAGLGLQGVSSLLSERQQKSINAAFAAIAVIIIAAGFYSLRGSEFFVAAQWPAGICYKKVTVALSHSLSKNTLIAPEAIGTIGYLLPEVPILDIFGLTEPYIARNGVIPQPAFTSGKHHYQYVMQQNPAMFLFHSDLIHHIPYLNKWGYSENYRTYHLDGGNCELLVGIHKMYAPDWVPALEQVFTVQTINTEGLPENPYATWPVGER